MGTHHASDSNLLKLNVESVHSQGNSSQIKFNFDRYLHYVDSNIRRGKSSMPSEYTQFWLLVVCLRVLRLVAILVIKMNKGTLNLGKELELLL